MYVSVWGGVGGCVYVCVFLVLFLFFFVFKILLYLLVSFACLFSLNRENKGWEFGGWGGPGRSEGRGN